MRARARSSAASSTSRPTTSQPPSSSTWAMPAPIVPRPTTPTRAMASIARTVEQRPAPPRPEARGRGRRLGSDGRARRAPADGALPLPPRPAAEVLVPPLRPAAAAPRVAAPGGRARERAARARRPGRRDGRARARSSPACSPTRAAGVRSLQHQIEAIAAALNGKAPGVTGETCSACGARRPAGRVVLPDVRSRRTQSTAAGPRRQRRAAGLAALLAVAVLGAVGGAWIERQRSDPQAAPVTVPTIVTQTVTQPAPPPVVTTVTVTVVRAGPRAVAPRARRPEMTSAGVVTSSSP